MFRYNSKANYQPNGGQYLQILSGKDFYKQTIVVGSKDTFPARFPNIFIDYPIHWDKCMWVINCGQIGTKLLCNYGSYSYILWCGAHQVLVELVLRI